MTLPGPFLPINPRLNPELMCRLFPLHQFWTKGAECAYCAKTRAQQGGQLIEQRYPFPHSREGESSLRQVCSSRIEEGSDGEQRRPDTQHCPRAGVKRRYPPSIRSLIFILRVRGAILRRVIALIGQSGSLCTGFLYITIISSEEEPRLFPSRTDTAVHMLGTAR